MQEFETTIAKSIQKISELEGISGRTIELMKRFDAENKATDIKAITRKNNMVMLRLFLEIVKKPIEDVNKDDLIKFFSGDKYSKGSLNGFKGTLGKFFRWFNDGETLPENLKGARKILKLSPGTSKVPNRLLSTEDVKRLAAVATNPRDRLIPLFLFETGCRAGELLNIRLSDIEFDQYGAKVSLRGKTGERQTRLIDCVPDIRKLMENHPHANNKDAPLFSTYIDNKQSEADPVISAGYLRLILIKLAERAGLDVRIHPHLFRHSAATLQASELTEWELRTQFGWAMGSPTPAVYVHRSGINLDRKKLALRGLVDLNGSAEKKKTLELIVCPKCQTKNGPVSRFCCSCSQPLDAESIEEYEGRQMVSKFLNWASGQPEGKMFLAQMAEKYQKQTETNRQS